MIGELNVPETKQKYKLTRRNHYNGEVKGKTRARVELFVVVGLNL